MIAEMQGLHRLAAFATDAGGGNPAGVWVGPALPDPEQMLRIAADVGYSETSFLEPLDGDDWKVRYYSPLAEVPFCGHATIAAGVHVGRTRGAGRYNFQTAVGEVNVDVARTANGWEASLTSVATKHVAASEELLRETLALLDWQPGELDPAIPPVIAFAGAWHLVLAATSSHRLATLSYDFDKLQRLMLDANLTTLQLIWRESEFTYRARNPFPVGGVVEDPATGAAAAALGGYLRDAGLIVAPAELLIMQGIEMGSPSRINVAIPVAGGIQVRGTAVDIGAGTL